MPSYCAQEYIILTTSSTADPTGGNSELVNIDRPKVIIVGAGVAGLTAANRFAKSGKDFDIQILEASDQFGGRISKMDNFTDFPIDLGASLIHSPKWFEEIAETAVPDIRTEVLDSKYEGEHGMSLIVGATWFDFLNAYLAPDPTQIAYNCRVDRIAYGPKVVGTDDPIRVDCGDRSFFADAVIVTTPLSALKDSDISFQPSLELPSTHPGEMWAGIKVIFEFQNKFYPPFFTLYDQYNSIEYAQRGNFPGGHFPGEVEFWDYSVVNTKSYHHILGGNIIGRPAMDYIDLDDEEICKAILQRLDKKFGDNVATGNYTKHKVVNWSKSPFIRGSFASQSSKAWKGPQNVTETLYFAGEAFPGGNQEEGWVHSAALSGKEAASKLIGYLDQLHMHDKNM